MVYKLGYEIAHQLSKNLIITTTSIVSAVLLMQRKGISEEELIKHSKWVGEQMKARGAVLPYDQPPTTVGIKEGINHLIEFVDHKKDMFEPSVTPKIDYKNYLMLSIYKNGLIHLFFPECFIACTLMGFKQKIAFG